MGLATTDVAKRAGITYRVLDLWAREGVLTPGEANPRGTGYPRSWAPEQVRIARVLAVLREHGAPTGTLAAVARSAEALPEGAWETRVLVRIDGSIRPLLADATEGWTVDLARCVEAVGEDLAVAV